MKLRKKILLTAGVIGLSIPAIAETSYQCLSCPSGTYSAAGSTGITSCKTIGNLTASMYTKTVSASQGSCSTGTLTIGQAYRVVLRGGKGGSGDHCERSNCIVSRGANGGFVEYEFVADKNYTYKLCAGGDGSYQPESYSYSYSINSSSCSTGGQGGGGAGSWIELNDGINNYYIVAGGGGGSASGIELECRSGNKLFGRCEDCSGVSSYSLSPFAGSLSENLFYGDGGNGGGIGSGANPVFHSNNNLSSYYHGGTSVYGTAKGSGGYGPGLHQKNGESFVYLFGKVTKTIISVGGEGGKYTDENSRTAPSEGKASHNTNVSTLSGKCSGTTGCAVLLSL